MQGFPNSKPPTPDFFIFAADYKSRKAIKQHELYRARAGNRIGRKKRPSQNREGRWKPYDGTAYLWVGAAGAAGAAGAVVVMVDVGAVTGAGAGFGASCF